MKSGVYVATNSPTARPTCKSGEHQTAGVCARYEEDTSPLPSGHEACRRLRGHARQEAFSRRRRCPDPSFQRTPCTALRGHAARAHSLDAGANAPSDTAKLGLGSPRRLTAVRCHGAHGHAAPRALESRLMGNGRARVAVGAARSAALWGCEISLSSITEHGHGQLRRRQRQVP